MGEPRVDDVDLCPSCGGTGEILVAGPKLSDKLAEKDIKIAALKVRVEERDAAAKACSKAMSQAHEREDEAEARVIAQASEIGRLNGILMGKTVALTEADKSCTRLQRRAETAEVRVTELEEGAEGYRVNAESMMANLRRIAQDIYERREFAECWHLPHDGDGDCGNWPVCDPELCSLATLGRMVGFVPQEDGGLDKQRDGVKA